MLQANVDWLAQWWEQPTGVLRLTYVKDAAYMYI